MKSSPVIVVTKSATSEDEAAKEFDTSRPPRKLELSSSTDIPITQSPNATRMSLLNVDDDSIRRPPPQRGGSLAAIRRHTVMLARDVLLRRLSRNDSNTSTMKGRITLEDFGKLMHEINHMLASYRQLLQTLGTPSEMPHARKELASCRRQCLRTSDAAKECILPLIKENDQDPRSSNQTSELAKRACHQFIGCLTMFVLEMKRTHSLMTACFSTSGLDNASCAELVKDDSSYVTAMGSYSDVKLDNELENLSKDIKQAEATIETLENAITVHFSTEPYGHTGCLLPITRIKRSGHQLSKFCVYFQTRYA